MRARPSPIPAPAEPTVSVCAGGLCSDFSARWPPARRPLPRRSGTARTADTVTVEEADEVGRRDVLDLVDDESAEGIDVLPARTPRRRDPELPNRRRLNALAREADALATLATTARQGVALIKQLVADGYNPIVFCRFIPTAHLPRRRAAVQAPIEVAAVTESCLRPRSACSPSAKLPNASSLRPTV